jgi:hypothetical protein
MLVSSTSMNAANETTAAITHGLTRRFAGVAVAGINTLTSTVFSATIARLLGQRLSLE